MLLTPEPQDKPPAAPEHTMLLQLRLAAQRCSKIEYRQTLYTAADKLAVAINHVYGEPTETHMRELNCAWANAHRILKETPPEGGTDPLGGSTRPTVFEESPGRLHAGAKINRIAA